MFDHVKFGVSDYAASKAFFLKALEPLGVTVVTEWPPNGVELSQPKGKVSLCLYQTEETPAHLHLASRLRRFWPTPSPFFIGEESSFGVVVPS